jgi:hypothetical protein
MGDDGPTYFKLQDSDWVGAKWGVYCHLGCYTTSMKEMRGADRFIEYLRSQKVKG